MNTGWLVTNALASLMLPPASLLLMAGLGAVLARRRTKTGIALMALAALLLLVAIVSGAGAAAFAAFLAAPLLGVVLYALRRTP